MHVCCPRTGGLLIFIICICFLSHPPRIVIERGKQQTSTTSQCNFHDFNLIKKKQKQTFVFYEYTRAKFILKTFDVRTFRCEAGKRKYSQCFLPGPFSGGQGFFFIFPNAWQRETNGPFC